MKIIIQMSSLMCDAPRITLFPKVKWPCLKNTDRYEISLRGKITWLQNT